MADGDLVERVWVGPFAAELPDGRTIQPGDTAMVTEADAESTHWLDPDAPPDAPAAEPEPAPEPEPPAPDPFSPFEPPADEHSEEPV